MTRRSAAANIEVHGGSIQSLLKAMEFLKLKAQRVLGAHGITHIDPQGWYPLPALLDVYDDILAKVGPSTMHSIGQQIPKHAIFPPELTSFEQALQLLDKAYHMNHRGSGDIGSYRYQSAGPRAAQLHCDNLYPCPFDEGIVQALFERFPPQDSVLLRMEHTPPDCRLKGAAACVYSLKW